MKRLGPFVFLLGVYSYMAWRFSIFAKIAIDPLSFVIAIIVAGLTGATWFTVSDWWGTVTRPNRPQTVTLPTKETPNQIVNTATLAMIKGILVIIALVGLVFVLRDFLIP